jgi:hypothetical protein
MPGSANAEVDRLATAQSETPVAMIAAENSFFSFFIAKSMMVKSFMQ